LQSPYTDCCTSLNRYNDKKFGCWNAINDLYLPSAFSSCSNPPTLFSLYQTGSCANVGLTSISGNTGLSGITPSDCTLPEVQSSFKGAIGDVTGIPSSAVSMDSCTSSDGKKRNNKAVGVNVAYSLVVASANAASASSAVTNVNSVAQALTAQLAANNATVNVTVGSSSASQVVVSGGSSSSNLQVCELTYLSDTSCSTTASKKMLLNKW